MSNARSALTRIGHGLALFLGIDAEKGPVRAVLEIAAVLAISFASTTALAQPFYVPSGSMQPTLAIGDAFVAAKYPYGYSRYSVPFAIGPDSKERLLQKMPKVGDVVVFRLPRDPSQTLVKRVIGLPGDRIQMRAGRLWINDKELTLKPDGSGTVEAEDGTQTTSPKFIETLPNGVKHPIFKWTWTGPLDDTPAFAVPAGHIFLMGDNRDNSLDSRVPADEGGVGFVPVENLVGRAEFVVGSYDFLNAHHVWAWLAEFRLSRFFNGID
ncbi:MAG TPA: signal peptidase I [Rhizomicrobium sp.]|jgi:signal peptidase I